MGMMIASAQLDMDATKLAALLGSEKPSDVDAARDALERIPKEAATGLLVDVLVQEERRRDKRHRIYTALRCTVILFLLAGGIVSFVRRASLGGSGHVPWYILVWIFPHIDRWILREHRQVQRHAAVALARLDNVHAIGPLLDVLSAPPSSESSENSGVLNALTRLLPRLGPEQAYILNKRQHDALCTFLSSRYQQLCVGYKNGKFLYDAPVSDFYDEEAECYVAMIRALERLGDKRAVPMLKRIVGSETTTRNQVRVRDAALECLAALRARMV